MIITEDEKDVRPICGKRANDEAEDDEHCERVENVLRHEGASNEGVDSRHIVTQIRCRKQRTRGTNSLIRKRRIRCMHIDTSCPILALVNWSALLRYEADVLIAISIGANDEIKV